MTRKQYYDEWLTTIRISNFFCKCCLMRAYAPSDKLGVAPGGGPVGYHPPLHRCQNLLPTTGYHHTTIARLLQ